MRLSNKERWINAMVGTAELLKSVGLNQRDFEIVKECFEKYPPKRPSTKTVLALEREYQQRKAEWSKEAVPESPPVLQVKARRQRRVKSPRRKPKTVIDMSQYAYPLVRVTNLEGRLLRYEDAKGQRVPEELWPRVGVS